MTRPTERVSDGRLIVRRPGEGHLVPGPEGITLKATAEETGGSIGVFEATSQPGFEAPPHIHHTSDELFYVLEGEFEFLLGFERVRASAGSFVFVPRGTVHSPRVPGPNAGRAVMAFVPGGQEAAFEEFGDLARQLGAAFDFASPEVQAIARKYKSEFVRLDE